MPERLCHVPVSKVRDYLLNSEHEAGGPKSVFFKAHGFSAADHDLLSRALAQHFAANEPFKIIDTGFGLKYVVRGEIQAPDGRRPTIQSVWIVFLARRSGEIRDRRAVSRPQVKCHLVADLELKAPAAAA